MRFLHLIARFAVVSSSKSSGNGVLEVLEYCNLFLDRFAPAKRVEVAQYTVFLSLYELKLELVRLRSKATSWQAGVSQPVLGLA